MQSDWTARSVIWLINHGADTAQIKNFLEFTHLSEFSDSDEEDEQDVDLSQFLED